MTTSHSSPETASPEKMKALPFNINKLLYVAFTLMAVLYWFLGSDKSHAISQLGIALVFDPFNPEQPFGQRPKYQKIWLMAHLGLVLTGFLWLIFK